MDYCGLVSQKLEEDEKATLLAALRWYQLTLMRSSEVPPAEVLDVATDGGKVHPLDSSKIEKLCEKIKIAREFTYDEFANFDLGPSRLR